MRERAKRIVKFVHILSFCGTLIVGALGIVYELVGYAKFEQMLSGIGISNGLGWLWIVGAVMLLLLIATHFIKEKL